MGYNIPNGSKAAPEKVLNPQIKPQTLPKKVRLDPYGYDDILWDIFYCSHRPSAAVPTNPALSEVWIPLPRSLNFRQHNIPVRETQEPLERLASGVRMPWNRRLVKWSPGDFTRHGQKS